MRNNTIVKMKKILWLFSTAKWILGKRHQMILIISSLGQIMLSLLDILFLALIGPFIIKFSGQTTSGSELSILGGFIISSDNVLLLMVLMILIKGIGGLLLQRLVTQSFANREAEVSTVFVQASLFDRSNIEHTSHSSDLLQTFTFTISSVFGSLFSPMIAFIGELATLCAVIIGLLVINTEVAVLAICYFSIFGYFVIRHLGMKQQMIGSKSLVTGKKLLRSVTEGRLMARELRFAHKDQDFLKALNLSKLKQAKLLSASVFFSAMPRYIFEIIFTLGIGFTVLFLGYFQKNHPVLPTLALIVAAGYRILPSLNYITIYSGNFRKSIASLRDLGALGQQFNLRFTELKFNVAGSGQQNTRFNGDLHLEHVYYAYPISKKNIFTDLSLVIRSGETLLIQGVSGSGKTTLITLASGLIAPQKGRIYAVNGGKEFVMDQTVTGISYLSQDVPLLDESFAYNIALEETQEINFTRLTYSADKAGILDRILQSPMGFNAQIGENGSLLSAGERQRLGIARSLYADPSLLILDEPTANLDAAAEKSIWATLEQIKGQFTILIVSHRPAPETVYDNVLKLPIMK